MALGAIDAIERGGSSRGTIKLVGIDGTPAGQEAFREGKLFRTVESTGGLCEESLTRRRNWRWEKSHTGKYFWCLQHIIAN